MINIAQLGVGYWGPNLIRSFVEFDTVDKFTVCDPDRERLKRIKRRYPRVSITESTKRIFENPSFDAIVIVTPAATHYELVKTSLLAGKHVFVEKPLAMNSKEATEVCNLANRQGKILMVGHNFLFNAAVLKAKEYIDTGDLGEIYYILSQRLNLGRVRSDVNVMWNLAPHDISIILFWLEECPSKVSAKGLSFLQKGIDDVVFLDLDFPSGRAAHIHVSWLDPNKTRKIVVVGSKKMMIYDDVSSDAKITIFDKGIDRQNIIRELPDINNFGQFQLMQRVGDIFIPKIEFDEPLKLECQHFVDCIMNNTDPITNGENGCKIVEVLERAQLCLDSN
jgi:predicted dehydrogenase